MTDIPYLDASKIDAGIIPPEQVPTTNLDALREEPATDERTETERHADDEAARGRAQVIAFIASTTTTRVRRDADGQVSVHVEHAAAFEVTPGTVGDMLAEYSTTASFSTEHLRVEWENGELSRVTARGPQRLKAGGVSDKQQRKREWRTWSTGNVVPRADLPEIIAARIADYETAVAVATSAGGPR